MHQQIPPKTGRKKFLLWTAAVVSAAGLLRFFPSLDSKKKPARNASSKMLTQDGRLVEIDQRLLAASGKKISNEELQQWIKK